MLRAHALFHRAPAAAPFARLRVEFTQTPLEMQRGLAGRPALPDDCGMLFDMGVEGYHPFHMIGVAFPLDFILVTTDFRVAAVLASQPPGMPEVPCVSRLVIEAPSGWSARRGVGAGDYIDFVA